MEREKINLKKENYLYRLNIHQDELLKPFNFLPSDISKIMKGKMNQTSTITYRPNKDGYEATLRLFEDVDGIFKDEFQIELEISGETYQAFYTIDDEGYVFITKYEYLELIKIFEKMDYEVTTNLLEE